MRQPRSITWEPLLTTPALGAIGADRPLAAVLLALKEEDERQKAQEQRLAQVVAGRPERAGLEEWLKERRRKRKKRRKKVVPKSSSSRSCLSVSGYRPRSTSHLDFSGRRLLVRCFVRQWIRSWTLFFPALCMWQSLRWRACDSLRLLLEEFQTASLDGSHPVLGLPEEYLFWIGTWLQENASCSARLVRRWIQFTRQSRRPLSARAVRTWKLDIVSSVVVSGTHLFSMRHVRSS